MARRKPVPREDTLSGFKLLERFCELFEPFDQRRVKSFRESDPRRGFDAQGYFVMMLFTLLNPVIDSMRGLCAVSKFRRFEQGTGLGPVSLASFSEAQSVFDANLLRGVLRELLERNKDALPKELRGKLGQRELEAIDSTIWEVIPRMGWAFWREQGRNRHHGVRLHLRWRIFGGGCGGAELTPAIECEQRTLRHELIEAGIVYVGDRNYSGNYGLLERIVEVGSDFIVRLPERAVFKELETLPLTKAERAAGITHHVRVALGDEKPIDRNWRVVRMIIPGSGEPLMILASLPADTLSAGDLCEIYRRRWSIEMFFRWLKCTLPCRHWLAESPNGVAVQVYMALIAALLLAGRNGKLPGKRHMEAIRLWQTGWIEDDELQQALGLKKSS
ncbi:IS4 family transposase [Luteolibacter sp. Populi]|uniref:IS4 family transposase n=1 Tax=Luteolibacter sp. Populi TaxID=3230487 RepID=UPI0034654291